jgi:cyanophycinase
MSRRRSGIRGGAGEGRLVVIGGTDRRHESHETILEHFVQMSGGSDAHIIVIAAASESPGQREGEYADALKRLGAGRVEPLRLRQREDANAESAVEAIGRATGVFFTGGDELRLANIVGGSRVHLALHSAIADGLVLAGAGAGAAMMTSTMLLTGPETSITTSALRSGPGLEFLPGVILDTNYAERGRLNRLLGTVAMYPQKLGLAIDENTAVVVQGDRFEVIGTGAVTVVDAGPAGTIHTLGGTESPVALCGVRTHVLPNGYAFQLTERQPVVDGARYTEPSASGSATSPATSSAMSSATSSAPNGQSTPPALASEPTPQYMRPVPFIEPPGDLSEDLEMLGESA